MEQENYNREPWQNSTDSITSQDQPPEQPRQYTFQSGGLQGEPYQNQGGQQTPLNQYQPVQQPNFQQYQQNWQQGKKTQYFVEPDQTIPREELNPRKVLSKALLALFFMAIAVILTQVVVEIVVSEFVPEIAETDWYLWALTALSFVGIGLPVCALTIRLTPDSPKREKKKLGFLSFITIFFICTAAMYITNFFSVALNMAIALLKGENFMENNNIMDIMYGSNYLLTILYASIVAPVVEELIFRKLLLNKLRRFGDVPAIIITAVAFGLFHMNLSQVFYATVLGMIFAYVTCKTNTIRYSIILHMMINSIATFFVPLVTKQNLLGSLLILAWVGICLAAGITLFVLNFKKIRLEKGTVAVEKNSVYLWNVGTILFVGICLVMIVLNTVMPAS